MQSAPRRFHEDLYKRGFIEPIYDCEHLSPVVLVKKPATAEGKSRGYRMVVNMIARNATLESIANRMPECTEIFMALKGAKYLTTETVLLGRSNAPVSKWMRSGSFLSQVCPRQSVLTNTANVSTETVPPEVTLTKVLWTNYPGC